MSNASGNKEMETPEQKDTTDEVLVIQKVNKCIQDDELNNLPTVSINHQSTPFDVWCQNIKFQELTKSQISQLYHLREIIVEEQKGNRGMLLSALSDLLFEVYVREADWPPFREIVSFAVGLGFVAVVGEGDCAVISLTEEDAPDAVSKNVTDSPVSKTTAIDNEKGNIVSSEHLNGDFPLISTISQKMVSQLVEYIEKSPTSTLQALCDSGGMCDEQFAKLTDKFKIPPGKWWSCFSDAAHARSAMSAAILKMLECTTGSKWRVAESVSSESVSTREKEFVSMHPIVNEKVLIFWSNLRRQLRGLDSTHYRTLQSNCQRGGTWIADLKVYNESLKIGPHQWIACYASGSGCRQAMVRNITDMFGRFMNFIDLEKFKSTAENNVKATNNTISESHNELIFTL
jgi:hypothetical protein